MGFTMITITLDGLDPAQAQLEGVVTATLTEVIGNSGETMFPSPIIGQYTGGHLTMRDLPAQPFQVAATDDPGTSYLGAIAPEYVFTVDLDGCPLLTAVTAVSHTLLGGILDLGSLLA